MARVGTKVSSGPISAALEMLGIVEPMLAAIDVPIKH
jgi:hypothetical protein